MISPTENKMANQDTAISDKVGCQKKERKTLRSSNHYNSFSYSNKAGIESFLWSLKVIILHRERSMAQEDISVCG